MTPNYPHPSALVAAAVGLALMLASTASIAAGPGVHGRVLGHDEKGSFLGVVPGAKIAFEKSSGAKVAETASDKNGYYKIDLPPGEYLYKIAADGYRKEDAGRGMRLAQSEGYAVFNLALTKGQDDPDRKPPLIPAKKIGKLRGHVLEKTPSELIGIPDARIALRREGSRGLALIHSRSTADNKHQVGDYEITLEAGTYHASVLAAGFERLIDLKPIEIKADEETERDFVLSRPQPPEAKEQGIRGVVTIVDSESTPPPIKIQIVPLSGGSRIPLDVQPASNGAYSQALPPGRYRVIASAEGFPDAVSPPAFVFAGRFTLVNLTLRAERVPEPKTIVEVFVFTKPKDRDESVPLPGARVSLLKSGAGPQSAKEATSDSTGHAIFPVSEAGEYNASAFLKGYRSGSGSGAVQLGQSHEVGIELVKEDVTPPTELALNVTVSDAVTKQPLPGVRVLARQEGESLAESARGKTDLKGAVALMVKRTGNYAVLAQLEGYEPGGLKVDVAVRGLNRVAISLRPISPHVKPEPQQPDGQKPPHDNPVAKPQTVTGFVAYRELTGQLRSVANAKLLWERIAPATPPVTDFATTGGNGHYQVDVHVGTYQVRVQPPAGFEGLLEQVQIEPDTHEKYFIIRRAERKPPEEVSLLPVKGMVVAEGAGGRFTGIGGAEVLFIRTQGIERSNANPGGDFSIRLPADAYRVHVRARGYEPLETRADIRSGMSPLRFVLKRSEPSPTGFNLNVVVVERGRMPSSGMRAVADAKIHISLDSKQVDSGATNRSGQFSTRVKAGAYTVRVDKPDYSTATTKVVVTSRDVTEQIVLVRREGPGPDTSHRPTLTVRVAQRIARPPMTIKPTGSPIAGAQVSVMLGSKRVASGVTNAAGTYSVPLAAGNYSVKVEAKGFAPAGKTITLADRDVQLDFQLEQRNAPAEGATPAEDGGRPPRGIDRGGTPVPPGGAADVRYIVEYRLNNKSPWTVLATKQTQREANMALFLAVDRGQIPGSAETRIRVEKVRRAAEKTRR